MTGHSTESSIGYSELNAKALYCAASILWEDLFMLIWADISTWSSPMITLRWDWKGEAWAPSYFMSLISRSWMFSFLEYFSFNSSINSILIEPILSMIICSLIYWLNGTWFSRLRCLWDFISHFLSFSTLLKNSRFESSTWPLWCLILSNSALFTQL